MRTIAYRCGGFYVRMLIVLDSQINDIFRFIVGEAKDDDTSEFDYKWHIPFSYVYKVKDGDVKTSDIHWIWSDNDTSKF